MFCLPTLLRTEGVSEPQLACEILLVPTLEGYAPYSRRKGRIL